ASLLGRFRLWERLPERFRKPVQAVLIAIELLVAVALIVVVLLQRSEGGALGMGCGSSLGNLFSPRGAGDLLTRTTAILAALFFLTCLGLNIISLHGRDEKSFLETPSSPAAPGPLQKPALPTKPAPPPAVPTPH